MNNPFKIREDLERLSIKVEDLEHNNESLKNLLQEEKNKRIRVEEYARQLGHRIWQLERENDYNYFSKLDNCLYPHELAAWYFRKTGKKLDLNYPKTYNEKIQWFKLYGRTPSISELSDKIAVRSFVASRIGEEYLIPLIGTWTYPEEIDFSSLPDKFILKANHGSGFNYPVYNKPDLDVKDIINVANQWLRKDFSFTNGFELQYHDIPRRLLIEEYLENEDGDLDDYKFRCFNGRVELISFVSNRYHGIKMDWFDRNWNPLPITLDGNPHSEKPISRPDNLDEMIGIAEALASGFPHVRVDLYRLNNGRIYFGEMTFTPSSGAAKWDPPELDAQLGSLFTYPGMPE